jgi:N-acetyl-anhydromuramyl-L-alanine amidase AmpD
MVKRWIPVLLLILSFIASDAPEPAQKPTPVSEQKPAVQFVLNLPKTKSFAHHVISPTPQPVVLPSLVYTEMRLPEEHSRLREGIEITHVVLHFSSNVKAKPEDPFVLEDIYQIYHEANASSHFLIDREGELFSLVSEERIAFHAGKGSLPDFPELEDRLNEVSIGIEMLAIGTKEEMKKYMSEDQYDRLDPFMIGYTPAQYITLRSLLRYLYQKYPGILPDRKHVVGHDQYAPGRKFDPGALFDYRKIGLGRSAAKIQEKQVK